MVDGDRPKYVSLKDGESCVFRLATPMDIAGTTRYILWDNATHRSTIVTQFTPGRKESCIRTVILRSGETRMLDMASGNNNVFNEIIRTMRIMNSDPLAVYFKYTRIGSGLQTKYSLNMEGPCDALGTHVIDMSGSAPQHTLPVAPQPVAYRPAPINLAGLAPIPAPALNQGSTSPVGFSPVDRELEFCRTLRDNGYQETSRTQFLAVGEANGLDKTRLVDLYEDVFKKGTY